MIRKFKIKLLPSSFGLREFFSGSSWYTSAWATILYACLHTCSGSYLLSLLLLEGHNISGPSLKDTSNILQNFRKLSQLDCLNTTIGYVYLKATIYIKCFCSLDESREFWTWYCLSHLAKCLSDLKQNGTQEKTPFSGIVFHTLSHGVLRFVGSVSFKNH